jgi:trk system potassium uptake protein TrkH
MSGFTTTGLSLIQDMDHIPVSLNMWRHILTFVGGQGMVVLALTFLIKNTGGAYKVYVGEAKDVELVPNVMGTAKQIWKISMIYLAIGTAALWIAGITIGIRPVSALFQALFMFASSWSTGGFAPYSQNIMYYHSFAYEIITLVFFILGSLNFGLHYAVWQKNRRELVKTLKYRVSPLPSFLPACWLSFY